MWKYRNLSLMGKVLILNTLGLSGLIYPGTVYPIPKPCLNRVNTLAFNFLWSGRNEMIKHDVIFLLTNRGGLGLTNLSPKLEALQFKSMHSMTRMTKVLKWVFLAWYWIERTTEKYSTLWAFQKNNSTPHYGKTSNEKSLAYRNLLATLDRLKGTLKDLQAK